MANASLDENGRQTLIGTLNTDGATIVQVQANQTTHALEIDDNTTGSDNGNHASLDENSRQVLQALASDGSGKIVDVYVLSTGKLMIDSA